MSDEGDDMIGDGNLHGVTFHYDNDVDSDKSFSACLVRWL